MRWNTRGDLASGIGAGHNGLWLAGEPSAREIRAGLDGGVWLTDDAIISRDNALAALVAADRPFTLWRRLADAGNVFVGAGGNWAETIQAGPYTTIGQHRGRPLPARFVVGSLAVDASRDGALLFWAISGPSTGLFTVLWPDGTIQDLSAGIEARCGDGGVVLVWNGASLLRYTQGQPMQGCQVVTAVGLNKPAAIGEWVSYATDAIGRVLHRWDDASQGYRLTMGWSPDLLLLDGQCRPAIALGEAETPEQIHRDAPIVLGQGMVTLGLPVEPVTIPTFAPSPIAGVIVFDEPGAVETLIGVDEDATPTTRGIFCTFGRDDVTSCAARARELGVPLVTYLDGPDFPPSWVPNFPGVTVIPALQAYPSADLSVADRALQIERAIAALRVKGFTVAVVLAAYRNTKGNGTFAWALADVLDLMGAVVAAGRKQGARLYLPFVWSRGSDDGIARIPELAEAMQRLKAACPAAAPKATSQPAPNPKPISAPTPAPFFPSARPL